MTRPGLAIAMALAALLLSSPAQACSLPQKMPETRDVVRSADHVFVGTLRRLKEDKLHEVMAYEVTVVESIKGRASGTLHYFSQLSSAACGFSLDDGIYLFTNSSKQLEIAQGKMRDPYAGQASQYGAGLSIFGVHERHASASEASSSGRDHLSGGN